MRYSLDIDADAVKRYLRDRPELSRADLIRIYANLHGDLAVNADDYRADATRRQGPDSFWYRVFFPAHVIHFAVNDTAAVAGVLRVVYAEVIERSPP